MMTDNRFSACMEDSSTLTMTTPQCAHGALPPDTTGNAERGSPGRAIAVASILTFTI